MKKITSFIRLARPHQYIKNGFIWLPLFFSGDLMTSPSFLNTLFAFISFCLAASSIYAINDLVDEKEDRFHPVKRLRPIAAGEIGRTGAILFSLVFLSLSLTVAHFFLPGDFLWTVTGYILLNFAYSGFLKHHAIIDVTAIALGFVIRIFAGGIASGVDISPWIIIMTFLLTLFLALAKRRDDLLLAESGQSVKKSLDGYSLEFVSACMVLMTSVIIVAYILYTVSPEVVAKHGTRHLYLSGFWVLSGLLRYMQITFVKHQSGAPTLVLLRDLPLQMIVILWLANIYYLIY